MGLSAACDLRSNTDSVQGLAIFVLVVAAIGLHDDGLRQRLPPLDTMGGTALISGSNWVTSLRLAPVRISASGMPCASVMRRCLEPGRAGSVGMDPVFNLIPLHEWRTNRRPRATSRYDRLHEVSPAILRAAGPKRLVPAVQSAPAAHARAAAHFLWKPFPRNTGLQHEQDAGQHGAMVTARVARTAWLRWRQQRLDQLPQFVIEYRFSMTFSLEKQRSG